MVFISRIIRNFIGAFIRYIFVYKLNGNFLEIFNNEEKENTHTGGLFLLPITIVLFYIIFFVLRRNN